MSSELLAASDSEAFVFRDLLQPATHSILNIKTTVDILTSLTSIAKTISVTKHIQLAATVKRAKESVWATILSSNHNQVLQIYNLLLVELLQCRVRLQTRRPIHHLLKDICTRGSQGYGQPGTDSEHSTAQPFDYSAAIDPALEGAGSSDMQNDVKGTLGTGTPYPVATSDQHSHRGKIA